MRRRSFDLLPASAWGTAAELVVTAPIDNVWAGDVPEWCAEDMHQPGERPQCKQRERGQGVELEADWGRRHQLGTHREPEDPAEPDGHALAVVVVAEDVGENRVDHAQHDDRPEED